MVQISYITVTKILATSLLHEISFICYLFEKVTSLLLVSKRIREIQVHTFLAWKLRLINNFFACLQVSSALYPSPSLTFNLWYHYQTHSHRGVSTVIWHSRFRTSSCQYYYDPPCHIYPWQNTWCKCRILQKKWINFDPITDLSFGTILKEGL